MKKIVVAFGLLMLAGCSHIEWVAASPQAEASDLNSVEGRCHLTSMQYDGGDNPYALSGDLVSQWNSMQRGHEAFNACMQASGFQAMRVKD